MTLTPLAPTDTRFLFRPVSSAFVQLLRTVPAAAWARPTVAGRWVVRDVVAHLLDVTLRRLSFHRDAMIPPPPRHPIASDADFTRFINGLNAEWVDATRRLSPRVLTDMLEKGSADLADWFEGLPLDAPALFAVSWAGEERSAGWFDVGREFLELWHHQQQVRLALGVPSLEDPRYLRAVIEIGLRALPHAYRHTAVPPGRALVIDAGGPSGGTWSLVREERGWVLAEGEPPSPAARVWTSDDTLWRLLCNALPEERALSALRVEGARELVDPLLRARAVIV